jgi:hypothetical protein
MIRDAAELLARLRAIHEAMRDAVIHACERSATEQLAAASGSEGGDTIYAIDRVSERVLLDYFGDLALRWSFVLVAEGLGATGRLVLPSGTDAGAAELVIIVDPIDGTRGLMYQKRAAWILTGVAPNRGAATTLADIELALQTEIPLLKQHLCDALWTIRGHLGGERLDRIARTRQPLVPQPSRVTTIAQGFGGVVRFFPGGRDVLAGIDDAVAERLLGPTQPGRALAFEDQYLSTGGQLYELMAGHDRWIADLRPLLDSLLRRRGRALGLCCHPYDLCTESIARAAGVIVTDERGQRLTAPLDVDSDVAWIGIANQGLRDHLWPALRDTLVEHGLTSSTGAGHVAD